MQEAEVLVVLAEIAGVFVGFGALIAVRSGGASDATEVWFVRWVLSGGVWVMVAGLTPVVLGGYDLSVHDVWFLSSLVVLAASVGVFAVNYRTPESQALRADAPRGQMARAAVVWALLVVPVLGAPILVVLGLFPEQEAALYLTAVVVGVFLAALTLLVLVFEHRGPQVVASDEAEQPAE
jgi:hypothetical protein